MVLSGFIFLSQTKGSLFQIFSIFYLDFLNFICKVVNLLGIDKYMWDIEIFFFFSPLLKYVKEMFSLKVQSDNRKTHINIPVYISPSCNDMDFRIVDIYHFPIFWKLIRCTLWLDKWPKSYLKVHVVPGIRVHL